jgi:hypothetical protein
MVRFSNIGLRCEQKNNYRDVFYPSDCDAAVRHICSKLGWAKELEAVVTRVQAMEPAAAWRNLVAADEIAPKAESGAGAEPEPEAAKGASPRPSVHQLRRVDSAIAEAATEVGQDPALAVSCAGRWLRVRLLLAGQRRPRSYVERALTRPQSVTRELEGTALVAP